MSSARPADQSDRYARYAAQNDRTAARRDLLTPKQNRRWKHKLHAQRKREDASR